ncbi:MAG: radical protein [Flaviaesturariibacter sp.]|nr:radical protein [Flaviaesturariibacter sp.]
MINNGPIFVTHSYYLRKDPKQWKLAQPYAPLGTLLATAVLRSGGFDVHFYDCLFDEGAGRCLAALEESGARVFVICDDGFNYLTKMCLTNMREEAFRMISRAKEAGCAVIVSSSDSTDQFERYLQAGADYIVMGEPEQTLLELVTRLNDPDVDPQRIPGLAFQTTGGFVRSAVRPVLRDLDLLPLPAWDLLDLQPYRSMWMKSQGYFSINLATTRGCPFKCNWCAKPIYGNRYNSRSPEHVLAEIRLLQTLCDFSHIWFCDDIFGLKPGWVAAFSALLKKAGVKIRFKIQSRADLLLQENYVTALASAGCETVWMGAESGSQAILDAMDKGITTGQIAEATLMLRRHDIRPCFFIQFGYLGETIDDIRATIRMIHDLLPHQIGISVSYPLPGTSFHAKVKEQLKAKANWTDSDDLALLFSNSQRPAFYKQLHRYVHKSYRQRIGILQVRELIRKPSAVSRTSVRRALSLFYYAPASLVAKARLLGLMQPK